MANTYTLLETITVGAAGASSVTFNSIPQTGYTDLVIKASARSTTTEDTFGIRFNSDSGSNYPYRGLRGNGSTASSFSGTNTLVALGGMSQSNYTASTFGNSEFYIPNYTASNYKSVSVDAVNENNATTATAQLSTGLWNSTAAITTIQVIPSSGSFAQYSTFSLYGVSALGVTPTKAPKATGGSIIQTDGTYWYHAFLSSGTFTPATALTCDVLIVAGGGGGADVGYAGGGAGGLVYSTAQSVGTSAQTVTVGAGGAVSANGSNSVFAAITATGGGRAAESFGVGIAGGSGGGGSGGFAGGAASPAGQGFAGGAGSGAGYGGGGGGATAVGADATGGGAGNGGAGSSAFSAWASVTGTGVSGVYAKGGNPQTTVNHNSGYGGTAQDIGGTGAGSSGIVIVRYLAA
jgi:hypothetical protein